MQYSSVVTKDCHQLADYFGGEVPCSTLSEQQLLDNLEGSEQILICEVSQDLLGLYLGVLWSSLMALTFTATIPLLIVVMISQVVGRDFGKVLLFLIVLPIGVYGVWHLVIKELATNRYWEWRLGKKLDLTTREFMILATAYDRKQNKTVSCKETFPLDDLELCYSRIDSDDFRQVGIFLMPSKATKKIASKNLFNIEGFIYIQDSVQSLYEETTLPGDVSRIAQALNKKTGIKLTQKILEI